MLNAHLSYNTLYKLGNQPAEIVSPAFAMTKIVSRETIALFCFR